MKTQNSPPNDFLSTGVSGLDNILCGGLTVAPRPTWSDIPVDSIDVQRAIEHLGDATLLQRPVRTIALIAATQSAIRAGEVPTKLGIGPSMARQFAEMHGGTPHATSESLGKGSELVLRMPVVVQTVLLATPESSIDSCTMENMKARKILVVDDNVDAADTLEALLCMDGFKVTTAYDGIAAVAAAESIRPDVVVMDIGMPGMDGYEAARRMRQQPGGQDMVLIALTGWGHSTDKNRANDAGFDHHLIKPVDYDMLINYLQVQV